MNPLIMFYLGSHPDSSGRLLSEILEQDDYWLEVTHDYIQWLFPNKEKSKVTPGAPTITKEVRAMFEADEILQQHLMASFTRMLRFYGLTYTEGGIVKSSKWDDRKTNWFTEDTHNSLRITRILKCLSNLSLGNQAVLFQKALLDLVKAEPDCGIGQTTQQFWSTAIENP